MVFIDSVVNFVPGGDNLNQYINGFVVNYYETSIYNWVYPIGAIIIYLLSLYLLPLYMKNVRSNIPMKHPVLELFVKFHNIFLSIISLFMFLGLLGEIIQIIIEKPETGIMEKLSLITCDVSNRMGKGAIPFWLYIFYLSKYYEFIDTILLMVKCKPLTFLHTFHHASTLLLCWYITLEKSQIMWIVAALNTGVHVVMYSYFYVCTLKNSTIFTPKCLNIVKPWITRIQIIQFVLDLTVPKLWLWFRYVEKESCTGEYYPFIFLDIVVASFLVLFLNFYIKSYNRPENKKDE